MQEGKERTLKRDMAGQGRRKTADDGDLIARGQKIWNALIASITNFKKTAALPRCYLYGVVEASAQWSQR